MTTLLRQMAVAALVALFSVLALPAPAGATLADDMTAESRSERTARKKAREKAGRKKTREMAAEEVLQKAGPARPDAAVESRPGGTISLRFQEIALKEVVDLMSRHARVNILLGKGVAGTVSLSLYDVGIRDAIYAVAQAAGYTMEMRGDTFVILDRSEAGQVAIGSGTSIRTFKVQYSNPKQVAEILAKYLSRQGKLTTLAERNMLVVEDAPDFLDRVQRLLADIDVEPRQVMIEAKILEVALDKSETFGVDWSKIFSADGNNKIGTTGLAQRNASGLFFNLINRNFEVYLSALSSKGRVRTLSTPKLLALENQEASAVIGDRIGYKVTTTANQVTTETIQFLETGVILKVIPSVDQRGRVLLHIHPEVSSASVVSGIPSKKSTEVTTQLLCEDGQAIFVGGLIKRSSASRRSGVPGFSDLPAVGGLFSSSDDSESMTETVVIITPRIVSRAQDTLGGASAAAREVVQPGSASAAR